MAAGNADTAGYNAAAGLVDLTGIGAADGQGEMLVRGYCVMKGCSCPGTPERTAAS